MSARENTLCLLVAFHISSKMRLVILTIRLCVVWKGNRIVVVLAYLNFGVSIGIHSNGITVTRFQTLCIFSLVTFVMSYIKNKSRFESS